MSVRVRRANARKVDRAVLSKSFWKLGAFGASVGAWFLKITSSSHRRLTPKPPAVEAAEEYDDIAGEAPIAAWRLSKGLQ